MTTVVFADLVGSTRIFETLGDATASRLVTQLTTDLSRVFESQKGRVVKLLGDGLFVVFPEESNAVAACVSIQTRLQQSPVRPDGLGHALQFQMGIESGEVVEIKGDCYGDAVNSAARLADLAGAEQILTTQRVHDALPRIMQASLRGLGPMFLRGKNEATHVFRVEWMQGRDAEATVMGVSMNAPQRAQSMEIAGFGQTCRITSDHPPFSIGRAATADLTVNDSRVSRVHATIEARGGQFVLSDASSFGTWVYLGGQAQALALRRTECVLVGQGEIALGGERGIDEAPVLHYKVG